MFLEGVGICRPSLDIRLNYREGAGEVLVFHLFGQDIESLHKRQPGVDHRRKLSRKNNDILVADPAAETQQIAFLFCFFRNGSGGYILSPELSYNIIA